MRIYLVVVIYLVFLLYGISGYIIEKTSYITSQPKMLSALNNMHMIKEEVTEVSSDFFLYLIRTFWQRGLEFKGELWTEGEKLMTDLQEVLSSSNKP